MREECALHPFLNEDVCYMAAAEGRLDTSSGLALSLVMHGIKKLTLSSFYSHKPTQNSLRKLVQK